MKTDAPTRGRPREFDEGEVIDALMELFWSQGFESTSMAEISETAGLNKSSLYNAFGSKEAIFDRTLDRYLELRSEMLDGLIGGQRGLDDLLDFVEMVRTEASGEVGHRGCLGVNTTTELGPTGQRIADFSARYRAMMRAALGAPLARAAADGEIDESLVDVYVDAAVSFVIGMAVGARGGAGADELDRQAGSFRRLVSSWRRS